ncbi:MAG: tRNA (adenosine(37)-N6)-dimethylallyltransferase MiaA [Candidatus Omnitrophota bacterium]
MKNTSDAQFDQYNYELLPFCAIIGPTASGKTELALALAEETGADILCVDAIQVYRRLDVGSAKPTSQERSRIRHFGLDLASPLENFSASRFAQYAEPILQLALKEKRRLILCGGTGLYYRALLEGFFEAPDPDPDLRGSLQRRLQAEGLPALYAELRRLDPAAAASIHPRDARRALRALEIIRQTGQTVSRLRQGQQIKPWLALTRFLGVLRERDELARRIEKRTQWMYHNGLIEETLFLMELGCSPRLTVMQALGYKECYQYLKGKISLPEAMVSTASGTRRYSKRQMTWFRRQCPSQWISWENRKDLQEIVRQSLQIWLNSDNYRG